VAKQVNGIQGCTRNIASGLMDEILPLYSVLVSPQLEYWVQFWAPQYKGKTDILQRVAKAIKGLEYL